MTKKYNFNDDFEMLYLRHEYLSKIPNVDQIDITPFESIANATARLMYDKFRTNFSKVSLEQEDVASVTKVYLVAFLGLYSIKINEDALERFVAKYKIKNGKNSYPNEMEFERKDRNNLINFLRQRLYHFSTLCERKGRNILVGRDIRGAFAKTIDSTPVCDEELVKNHKKHGYRKVTKNELKEAKERSKNIGTLDLYDIDGFQIIEVEILTQGLWNIEGFNPEKDYDGHMLIPSSNCDMIYGESNTIYNSSPDQSYIYAEEEFDLKGFKQKFFKLDNEERIKKLKFFIQKYGNTATYKSEIKLAKKYISWFKEKHGIVSKYE